MTDAGGPWPAHPAGGNGSAGWAHPEGGVRLRPDGGTVATPPGGGLRSGPGPTPQPFAVVPTPGTRPGALPGVEPRPAPFLAGLRGRVAGPGDGRLVHLALWAALAAALASAQVVAALPALRAYSVPGRVGVVVAAGVGSTLVAFLAARTLRLAATVSYLLSAAALVVLLLVADGPHPGAVARALVDGPTRLLTETLPLGGGRVAITTLVVLVWVGGAATAEIIVRTSARRRPRSPFALVVPILVYLACFAASTAAPGADRYSGPVLLVALAAAAMLRHQMVLSAAVRPVADGSPRSPAPAAEPTRPGDDTAPPTPWRAVVTGVVAVVLATAAATVAARHVPALQARPYSLHRQPPTVTPTVVDPVAEMGQLRDGDPHKPPVPLVTVSFGGPSTGYLAMADLDLYDGAHWRFAATFEPTGGRVPVPAGASVPAGPTVTQDVDLTGRLPIPMLPALDRPLSVSGPAVVSDARTGMLLPQVAGAPTRYRVVSQAPPATLTGVPAADGVDSTMATSDDTALPPDTSADLATTLRFLSTAIGQRPAPTVEFLQRVAAFLQTKERRISPAATPSPVTGHGRTGAHPTTTTTVAPAASSGTSLSEVINAVTVDRAATPEQFATFFAMVARYVGVPARVVTGFRAAGSSAGPLLGAGTYRLTDRQAWTWVEVPVSGYGWVVADPTPDATTAAATPPPEAVQAPATTLPPRQANAVPRNAIVGGHAVAPPGHPPLPHHHAASVWLLIGAAGGLLLLLLLAGPAQAAARRAWRRQGRRSADPAVLAVGAWLELLDGLDRAGMRPPSGATNAEVVAEVGHHFGSELAGSASEVAALAERAVYSSARPPDDAAARLAWQAQRALRRRVTATLDLRQRLGAAVRVGSAPAHPQASGR